jgi:hypothetical protein
MNIEIDVLRVREDKKGSKPYGWDIGINFGRPDLNFSFTMRQLIHWAAYRLDTGPEDYIINHRAAVVLRSIAEEFYPYNEDEADHIIEELQDAGCTENFKFKEPRCPAVDVRLLDLHDGFLCVDCCIDETSPENEGLNPVFVSTSHNTVDFPFPAAAIERYGVAGLRLCVLDLIQWLRDDAQLQIMSYEDESKWLDELEEAHRKRKEVNDTEFFRRMCIRFGDDWEEVLSQPETSASSSEADAEMILRELEDLIR